MADNPMIPVVGQDVMKPRVTMAREFTPEEEWALIVFAVIRALSRWPETWVEELVKIGRDELDAQRRNGGEYPPVEQRILPED